MRPDRGLSLLEILISLMILALVMTGLANVFTVSRNYLQHTRSRMASTEMAKAVLSPLHIAVNASSYDSGALAVNPDKAGESRDIDGLQYSSNFNISDVPGLPAGGQLRKVKVKISWNEPQL